MPRGKLPSGFGKTLKALYAQGYDKKDAFREAWKIHRGSGPGMSKKQQPQKYLNPKTHFRSHAYIRTKEQADAWAKELDKFNNGQPSYIRDKRQANIVAEELDRWISRNPISHKKALTYARELVKHEKAGVKENPDAYYNWKITYRLSGTNETKTEIVHAFDKNGAFRQARRKVSNPEWVIIKVIKGKEILDNPGKRYRHAVSDRQRRFMGAELDRRRAGKRTETTMTTKQLREFARKPRRRKNPIVIYNPPRFIVTGATPLPIKNVEVRYQRSAGEYHGEWFRHPFKSSVEVLGLTDGSILIRSKSGTKLWGTV